MCVHSIQKFTNELNQKMYSRKLQHYYQTNIFSIRQNRPIFCVEKCVKKSVNLTDGNKYSPTAVKIFFSEDSITSGTIGASYLFDFILSANLPYTDFCPNGIRRNECMRCRCQTNYLRNRQVGRYWSFAYIIYRVFLHRLCCIRSHFILKITFDILKKTLDCQRHFTVQIPMSTEKQF